MRGRVDARGRIYGSLLVGLAPLLAAVPAGAQESWQIPGFETAGAGAFLGYAFGGERGIEWGIEAFATRYTNDVTTCSQNSRAGLGPLLRLSLLGISRLAVTGALHGGGEFERRTFALDAELGGTIAYQNGGARAAIHSGLLLESLFWNAYARQEWLLPSYSFGGGMRVQPTFGDVGFCAEGRLFRDERGQPRLARVAASASFDARCPAAARWAQRASEECASVPAFLQLALELAEHGAPTELVTRALGAACDELGHTLAAAELASRFGGTRMSMTPPAFRFRPALPRKQALRRLARESLLDGCLNEGLAASIARAELRETKSREEAATLDLIQREEAQHAKLALDVLGWTIQQAPELLRSLRVPNEPPALHTPSALRHEDLRALAHDQHSTAANELRALSG